VTVLAVTGLSKEAKIVGVEGWLEQHI